MKQIDFSKNGGFPLSQDRLAFMQQSYTEAIQTLAAICGDKTIVSGVVVTGANVSDGWIVYSGQLIRFVGGSLASRVVVTTTGTGLTFQNGITNTVLNEPTASCALIGSFDFADLKRLDDTKTTQSAVATLVTSMTDLTNRINALSWGDISGKPTTYIVFSGYYENSTVSVTREFGTLTINAARQGVGSYRITHNIGNSNYYITAIGKNSGAARPDSIVKTDTYFDILCSDDASLNDCDFYFQIIKY